VLNKQPDLAAKVPGEPMRVQPSRTGARTDESS
jgi:hypothetical protein